MQLVLKLYMQMDQALTVIISSFPFPKYIEHELIIFIKEKKEMHILRNVNNEMKKDKFLLDIYSMQKYYNDWDHV